MTRLLSRLARAALATLAFGLLAALSAHAENLFFIDNPGSGIYSVDINAGGPATRLVTLPGTQYNATLATRPSDGMLFWLDSNTANPNLWRWDPSNPQNPPVPLGTPGPTATTVLRLGFDVYGRLLAMDQPSSTLWNLSTTNGSILGTIPLSGTLPNGGGDLCLDPTNNTLYMVSNTELYTVSTTGQSTLLGTISGLSGGNAMTGCAVTSNGTLIVSQSNVGQLSRVTLGATPSATLLPTSTGYTNIGDLSSTSALVADLSVTKTAVNSTPGATASFTVTITNAGPDYATDVRVSDPVPTGLTFTSATATQGTYAATQAIVGANTYPAGTWRVGRLAANQSATLTIVYNVTGTTPIANTAQVSYSDMADPDSSPGNSLASEDDQASATITPSADLQIAKTAASTFGVGTNGTFTLAVRNGGSAASSGTYTVTDTLPPGLTFVSATGTNWSCAANTPAGANVVGGSQVSCTSSTVLAAGASANPITLTVAVASAALPSVTNTATVSGGEPASNNGNNTGSATVAVCPGPCVDLVPNKSVSASPMSLGTAATYTLTVSNLGALPSTAPFTIVDNLPAGLTLASVPAGTGWTCTQSGSTNTVNGNLVSCSSAATISGGAVSNPLTFKVNVGAAALPQVTNSATVSGGGDTYSGNNTVSLTTGVGSFDLAITKVATNDFTIGSTSGYLITVTNVGNAASPAGATTTLSDTLPANLTLSAKPTVAPTTGGWTCTGASGSTNFSCKTTSALAAGASYQFTVPISALATTIGTTLSNTATVANASEPSTLTGNNSATATDSADLVITKAHTDPFPLNTNSVYSLNVSNIGTVSIRGITTVTDVLPAGVTYVSATGTGWTCTYATASLTVTCNRSTTGNLSPGASWPPILITVTPTTAGSITNTASVSQSNEPAANTGNNTASDPTTILAPPTWSKSFSPTTITSGGTSTLTITINKPSGASSLTGIAFVDPLPSGMTVATPQVVTNSCGGTLTAAAGDTAVALSNGSFATASCAVTVRITANLTAAAPQTVTNTTGQLSTTNAGNAAAVTANLVINAPGNAVLTKATSPNPIGVGEPTTLTFTIVNKATTTNNLAFTDTFPSTTIVAATGATFTNTCGGTPSYTAPAGTTPAKITLTGVSLGGSATCTLSYKITGTTAGSYTNNTSNISGLGGGMTATTLSDTLVVQQAALSKDFSPSAILVGSTSTVTFTIGNTSEQPAFNNLSFTETLPTNLTLAVAPATPQCGGTVTGTAGGSTIAVTGAFLLANQSNCKVVAPVTSTLTNTYVNANSNVTASSNISKNVNAQLVVAPFPSLSKSVTVLNDPLNGTSNPKAIPGAEMEYTVVISNPGAITLDSGTVKITDALPANTSLYVGPTGPVTAFTTSAPGLTLTYTSPGDTSDDIAFSNTAGPGYTFGYTPVPVNNYDPAVTALQFSPKGTMPGASTATIKFKVQVR